MTKIRGKITKILFKKDDFIIAVLNTNTEQIKVLGNIYGVRKNEYINVEGVWETHPKFGEQLKVESWERPIPETEEQIIAYLSSPMVKGCGKKTAIKIVDELGEDTLKSIMKDRGTCLNGIHGLGKDRAKRISDSIVNTFQLQEIISDLSKYGIHSKMTVKMYQKHGANTSNVIKKNPYKLLDMNIIGFQETDEIARKIGIMPLSTYRIEACLKYILKQMCFEKGHSCITQQNLFKRVKMELNHNSSDSDLLSDQELETALMCTEEKYIIIQGNYVYPKTLYYSEEGLAQKLSKMKSSWDRQLLPFLEKHIKKHEKEENLILADKQKEAVLKLFEQQLLVLTGGPGTGKTTIIKTMIDMYKKLYPDSNIRLAAPTGRGSRKLSETVDYEASTIHKLIGYKNDSAPYYNRENQLICDFLIIDEMSMADVILTNNLLQAVRKDTKILFVGDTDQLPSVAPGNVLNDLIASEIATIKLKEVFRQAKNSQIVKNAHRINRGKSLLIDNQKKDLFFIRKNTLNGIAEFINKSVKRFLELGYSLSDILVLSPIKKGEVGTHELNILLRDNLNPYSIDKKEWKINQRLLREGDKVIQTHNNYNKDVFNGDLGIIKEITQTIKNGERKNILIVEFVQKKEVIYEKEEIQELQLAYAITTHKAEGGESPVVIMPATMNHSIMLTRNLIYTAITRAKERLVLIGNPNAIEFAIQNNRKINRNSFLTERIQKHIEYTNRYQKTI